MTLNEILVIMQNRLLVLTEAKKNFIVNGDIKSVSDIESDILSTKQTIEQIENVLRNL